MIETVDLFDDDELELPVATHDPDPISQGIGSAGYLARHTIHECIETFQGTPVTRHPDTFDRYYFGTAHGRVLVDILNDVSPEQLAAQRRSKNVDFKVRWCADHGYTYLPLPKTEISTEKIRRTLAGTPEPSVSSSASKRKPGPKRGQIQRPKAA